MKKTQAAVHTVKILPLGDSLTQGDGNPSAYRYDLYRLYLEAGVAFSYVGAHRSADFRLPPSYRLHCGHGGAVIGEAADEPGVNSLTAWLKREDHQKAVREAEIVLLYIGANDCGHGLHEGSVDRFLHLLDVIYGLNPSVIVYAMTLRKKKKYVGFPLTAFLLELDTEAYRAETGRELHVVDSNSRRAPKHDEADYPKDDGHPNALGNYKYAKIWFDATLPRVRELNRTGAPDEEVTVHPFGILTNLAPRTIAPGTGHTFNASVFPKNAKHDTLIWESSDPEILEAGEFGSVYAKAPGVATLTVKAADGGAFKSAEITVEGEEFSPVLGRAPLFRTEFEKKELFEGTLDCVMPEFRQLRVRYPHGGEGEIRTLSSFDTDGTFALTFLRREVTHMSGGVENSLAVSLGGIELCFLSLGERIELRQNGVPFAAMSIERPSREVQRYALVADGCEVSLYRDGVLILSGMAEKEPFASPLTFLWKNSWSVTHFYDLNLYR